jgi:hypothetical protein
MQEFVELYTNELKDSSDFKRLLELKRIIDKKYSNLIISLKTKEAIYLDSIDKPNHYDIDKVKKEFMEAKTNLYSKEEVKEYFSLERKINNMLEMDLNDIKESISNKFTKNNIVTID